MNHPYHRKHYREISGNPVLEYLQRFFFSQGYFSPNGRVLVRENLQVYKSIPYFVILSVSYFEINTLESDLSESHLPNSNSPLKSPPSLPWRGYTHWEKRLLHTSIGID